MHDLLSDGQSQSLTLGQLREMRNRRDVEGLIRALEVMDEDRRKPVRAVAARYLGELAAAAAVDPLIALLDDELDTVRTAAATALGRIGERAAVDPLISKLSDPSPWTRARVIGALGEIGDPAAVRFLVPLAGDESWMWVRAPALYALSLIDDPVAQRTVERIVPTEGLYARVALRNAVRKQRRRARSRRARA